MKVNCFVVFVIFIVGLSLASAFAAEQQTTADKPTPTPSPISELANLSFQLGIAYQQAQQSQNVTAFNSLVDQYNAWVQRHFSEGADALLMSKITATNLPRVVQKQQILPEKQQVLPQNTYLIKNLSGDLSEFGKQGLKSALTPPGKQALLEDTIVTQKMKNL